MAKTGASRWRRSLCLAARDRQKDQSGQALGRGTTGALKPGMPRTPKSIPDASRLVRKAQTAPRKLRVVDGGRSHAARAAKADGPADAAKLDTKSSSPHGGFATQCLPHQPELYGVAMRICRDPDTAKDLVQETLLRAMVAWASFEPGSNLRAWLFRILTNSFINGYRKRRRHQRFATERPGDALAALYGRDQDYTDDLEVTLYGDQLSDEVQGALARLGADYRDVVERADLKGQKYKDIADDLDVPIGTVMSRLFRARRVLEAELAGFAARDYGIKRAA
jgi:RNA polymerase sigma-70 factor, ECF subfamily